MSNSFQTSTVAYVHLTSFSSSELKFPSVVVSFSNTNHVRRKIEDSFLTVQLDKSSALQNPSRLQYRVVTVRCSKKVVASLSQLWEREVSEIVCGQIKPPMTSSGQYAERNYINHATK